MDKRFFRILCLLVLIIFAGAGDLVFGQEQNNDKPFSMVEQMPQPPGGPSALMKFIEAHIQYPQAAIDSAIQGRVVVRFVVNEDGTTSDFEIAKGLGGGCSQEALRVLKLMPKWKPGMQNGRSVKVWYTIPVSFMLGRDEADTLKH